MSADGILLITGGSRGIGAATARLASARGYRVWINYRSDRAAAEALAAEIGGHAIQADIGLEPEVLRLFDSIDRDGGRLTGLVNNAGIPGPRQSLFELDMTSLESVFRVNLFGAFLCAREAARRMARSRGGQGGAIVNLSSQAALTGGYRLSAYAASKAAIAAMTVSLCRDLAGEDVRVNAVRPGVIDTEQQRTADPARLAAMAEGIPLKRLGTPDEVAAAILWLLSPEASYVNGAILDATGGR